MGASCRLLAGEEMNTTSTCENTSVILEDSKPGVSILMFSAGLVGNVLALVLLGVHRNELRTKSSVFCILVTGLAVTDLMGTCFLSPVVFVSYAKGRSLIGLVGNHTLCDFFAFGMTFFGLASTLILFAMAVERCMAISHPYFYSQHIGRSCAKVALPVIYAFAALFCIMPFAGFGEHKQYCPGTWCFLKMESSEGAAAVGFSLLYAALIAFLIIAVLLCNGSVIVSLCKMHRNQKARRGSVLSSQRRRKSLFGQREEEVDHLILLASMTTIFAICSLPLTHLPNPRPLPTRRTRAADAWEHHHLQVPLQVTHHPDLELYRRSFAVAGSKSWNYLPNSTVTYLTWTAAVQEGSSPPPSQGQLGMGNKCWPGQ
ncbi:prostacyclin receptor isoform X1 [Heterodontus francisci]|uniref:prostacyclin receptor isoform X1 n=1 Tax=Heterodontus francisci TaxID=7792 RepID=UPI00355B4852